MGRGPTSPKAVGSLPQPPGGGKLGLMGPGHPPGRSADSGNLGIAELSPLQIAGGLSGGPSLSPGC